MNYIVLDLEWNQCPTGKSGEIRRLPFEIIEIGAVKLDENLQYVDSFREIERIEKNAEQSLEELRTGNSGEIHFGITEGRLRIFFPEVSVIRCDDIE